ncbi:MAG: BlaI/MecI/CopY family transcriptional regulator [Ruminococcaceae bacterium]|nr:BlaI/MecI/CopY family transcriptional regulator [Oscillospiraceae bacterium]
MTLDQTRNAPGIPGAEAREIDYSKKLPDAEFEVMQAIWAGEPPLNTAYLMEKVGHSRGWKAPTLISFLVRLEERGYITSEKKGKERYYTPAAERERYLRSVTEQFVEQYHGGSFVRMMDALYNDKKLSEADIDELLQWLKTKY